MMWTPICDGCGKVIQTGQYTAIAGIVMKMDRTADRTIAIQDRRRFPEIQVCPDCLDSEYPVIGHKLFRLVLAEAKHPVHPAEGELAEGDK